jgi:Ca-activated chloride channel homolog
MFLPTRLQTTLLSLRKLSPRLLLTTLLCGCVFGSCPANAQEPTPDDEVLKVSTDLLLFPIRIRDRQKQAVTTLTERDLTLKDSDGITSGLYFSQGLDRVALVFALDQSGSTRETIGLQRNAALELFSQFGQRSKVAVIRFAEKPVLASPFGRDAELARKAFDFSTSPNQHTAIFDAAAKAVSAFDELPRVRSERRIVILISDGLDTASRIKADAVISAAQQTRVSFYVVHIPLFEPRDGRLAVRTPAKGFRELAEKTNGKYFLTNDATSALAPKNTIDLAPTFKAIEDDLRSQYLLGVYLGDAAHDGRKHNFSLSLPPGYEYQVSPLGYSRTHKFFVNRPREALKTPAR